MYVGPSVLNFWLQAYGATYFPAACRRWSAGMYSLQSALRRFLLF